MHILYFSIFHFLTVFATRFVFAFLFSIRFMRSFGLTTSTRWSVEYNYTVAISRIPVRHASMNQPQALRTHGTKAVAGTVRQAGETNGPVWDGDIFIILSLCVCQRDAVSSCFWRAAPSPHIDATWRRQTYTSIASVLIFGVDWKYRTVQRRTKFVVAYRCGVGVHSYSFTPSLQNRPFHSSSSQSITLRLPKELTF